MSALHCVAAIMVVLAVFGGGVAGNILGRQKDERLFWVIWCASIVLGALAVFVATKA